MEEPSSPNKSIPLVIPVAPPVPIPAGVSAVPDPPIRTLKVELLSHNSSKYIPCQPNSREPTPFETEFFKGIAMIMVRTKPVDPFFQSFFNGKRLFEVQVQGKFKREPAGEIMVGAEGANKLELGLLTRSISRVVAQFISTMVGDLHYAFGDHQDSANFELPHVVSPIFPTFDKILVTPPGETPPPLGIPFTEDLEYRKKRMKWRLTGDAKIDINNIYSFSVNTSNLDLLTWTIVGVPMVKPMDLATYSGSGAVQLIGYEIPRSVSAKFPSSHPHKLLNYVFSMRLTRVDPDEAPMVDLPLMTSEDELEIAEGAVEEADQAEQDDNDDEHVEDDSMDEDDGEHAGKDSTEEEKNPKKAPSLLKKATGPNRGGVGSWLRRKFTRKGRPAESGDLSGNEGPDTLADDYNQQDYDQEASGDLAYCPACVELNEYRRESKRRFYYLIPLPASIAAKLTPSTMDFRVRTYSEIDKKLPLPGKTDKGGRLSSNEKRRKQIVDYLASHDKDRRLENFLAPCHDADLHFLGGNIEVEQDLSKDKCWRGGLAVAISRRHWSEQFMIVTRDQLILQRSRDSKRVVISIAIADILSVRAVLPELCPLDSVGFLEVETHTRVFTFMVRSDMQINGWLEAFVTLGIMPTAEGTLARRGQRTGNVYREEVYIARPACWKTDKKRVYNYRRIQFKGLASPQPNELIERILATAFFLCQADAGKLMDSEWQRFWDDISLLQAVNLINLTDAQRLAFFLNLYHVMVLHGCLMFGPPPAWNHWNAFFNNISYVVSFELVSIAEIEYCVLRAAMAKSSLFTAVAMPAPPQTALPTLAMHAHKDFRLHFAINCGSLSLLAQVPIYTAERLDQQLDDVTRRTLEHSLEIDMAKKVVVIPKLPLADYCSLKACCDQQSNPAAHNKQQAAGMASADCLRALAPYLSKAQKTAIFSLLSDPQHLTVRSRNLNFKCRVFRKWDTGNNLDRTSGKQLPALKSPEKGPAGP